MSPRRLLVLLLFLLGGTAVLVGANFLGAPLPWSINEPANDELAGDSSAKPNTSADKAKAAADKTLTALAEIGKALKPDVSPPTTDQTSPSGNKQTSSSEQNTAIPETRLDISRVSKTEASVLAGSSRPDTYVTVLADGTPVGTAKTDRNGDWSLVTEHRFANLDPKWSFKLSETAPSQESKEPTGASAPKQATEVAALDPDAVDKSKQAEDAPETAAGETTSNAKSPSSGSSPAQDVLRKFEKLVEEARKENKDQSADKTAQAGAEASPSTAEATTNPDQSETADSSNGSGAETQDKLTSPKKAEDKSDKLAMVTPRPAAAPSANQTQPSTPKEQQPEPSKKTATPKTTDSSSNTAENSESTTTTTAKNEKDPDKKQQGSSDTTAQKVATARTPQEPTTADQNGTASASEREDNNKGTGQPPKKVARLGASATSPPSEKSADASGTPSRQTTTIAKTQSAEKKETASGDDSNASLVAIPVPIMFVYDEATLTPEGNRAAKLLLEYVTLKKLRSVSLTGHADERGTHVYNMDLSRERLAAVADILKRGGYNGELDLVPKGKTEPYRGVDRSQYSRDDLYQLDRRVELRFVR